MTAIAIVVALAALVWATVFILRGQLVAGCLVMLLAAACFGHESFSYRLGAIPLTLDRVMLLLLLVGYAVQRRLGRTEPKPLGWPDGLLLGLVGVLAMSTLFSDFAADFSGQGSPLWRLVCGYMVPVLIYWVARQAPLDRSKLSLVHGTLACLGIYLAVTGILEISGQWWAVFPRYIADPQVGIHFGRARGPMVHSVSFGLYLASGLLCLWFWRARFGRLGQLVLLALVPLFMVALYFSYTRSVWLGAALGMMIVLGLTLRGNWRPLVLGSMVAAGLLLAVTRFHDVINFQRDSSAADTGKSVDMRASFAYVSWEMFLDRPILGFGFGQFPEAKLPYLSDRSTDLNLESIRPYVHHNTFLSILTETGLVGFGLFLALLAAWVRTGWRLCRDPQAHDWARAQGVLFLGVLGVYVCQAVFHELSYLPMDNMLLFFMAGLTVGVRGLVGGAAVATAGAPPRSVAAWPAGRPQWQG